MAPVQNISVKLTKESVQILENISQLCNLKISKFIKEVGGDYKSPILITLEDLQEIGCSIKDLKKSGHDDIPYLHEILKDCQLDIPAYSPPPRSAELEARIAKLKIKEETREYKRMTANVDRLASTETISFQKDVKAMQSQMIAVFNSILCVGVAFAVAYKAAEFTLPAPDIPVQVIVALITATVVALADFYILAKYTM